MASRFSDDEEFELKFEDCFSCKNLGRARICNRCDVGEEFEEKEPEGLDDIFRERGAW